MAKPDPRVVIDNKPLDKTLHNPIVFTRSTPVYYICLNCPNRDGRIVLGFFTVVFFILTIVTFAHKNFIAGSFLFIAFMITMYIVHWNWRRYQLQNATYAPTEQFLVDTQPTAAYQLPYPPPELSSAQNSPEQIPGLPRAFQQETTGNSSSAPHESYFSQSPNLETTYASETYPSQIQRRQQLPTTDEVSVHDVPEAEPLIQQEHKDKQSESEKMANVLAPPPSYDEAIRKQSKM